MTYRLRNVLLAVVLAVLAAFMTALYVANYQNRVDEGQELVKVFVAKSDIPPGTPASQVAARVSQKEVQSRSVAPVAVLDMDDVKGQTTSQWIYTGEQVSARRFNETGRTGIPAELKGNLRAFSLNGNQQQVLAGVLRTGDHVDVVANLVAQAVGSGGGDIQVSRVLLRDLRVLKAPSTSGIDEKVVSAEDGAYKVVLQVTDAQAHKLFFATAPNVDHEWWLDLRAPGEATDGPESITTFWSAVRDGLPANQLGRLENNR